MSKDRSFQNIFDDGVTTFHEDGSKSVTYKNVLDGGTTTYHEDGSRSRTYKNALDGGYTTYHEDGSRSRTYRNVLDPGATTYHEDGSRSVTYQNVLDGGYTTYHQGMPGGAVSHSYPAPAAPQAPAPANNRSFGGSVKRTLSNSSFDNSAHKLKGLKTAELHGEELKGYAVFAASLLLQQKVPFDKTAEITQSVAEEERCGFLGLKKRTVYRKHVLERHNCWLMEQQNETDEDAHGNEREDTTYYVLTEEGAFLRGSERDYYYAGGGYSGNPLKWEHVDGCVSSRHIDLYLKSKNINMSSGMYKAMLGEAETPPSAPAPNARHGAHTPGPDVRKTEPPKQFRRAVKMDPNEPCPCGSGRKYKDCHGKNVTIIRDKPRERMDANRMAPAVLAMYESATTWSRAKELRMAAGNGDEEAQVAYGLCLLTGHGAPVSREMGLSELRSAAEKGHPFAQYLIARCREESWFYRCGVDVTTVNWYLRAASGGYREAKLRAAHHIAKGRIQAEAGTAESLVKQAGAEDKAETAAREKIEAYLIAASKQTE